MQIISRESEKRVSDVWWNDHDSGARSWNVMRAVYGNVGSFTASVSSVTGSYTIGQEDHVVLVDTTSTALTVTLPTAAGIRGRQYIVINTGTKIATINTTSSQTINGGASFALPAQYFAVTLISDGSNWLAI